MSRKNFSIDRRPSELVSRYPAHCLYERPPDSLRDFALDDLPSLCSLPVATTPFESWRRSKRAWCVRGNHGSIRGSRPIAISDYPRRHSVKMVTRCRSTCGPAHRLILTLESSASRTQPTTTRENHQRWQSRFPEMLKLLADLIAWRRSPPLSSTWLK